MHAWPSVSSVTRWDLYLLSESLTCLKFLLWKLNICLLKGYLVQNSSSFVFIYLISSIKSDLFWAKNTFVSKEIFVAKLIFFHFHSLWFFFYKKLPLFHVLWFLIWKLMAHHCTCDSKQSHVQSTLAITSHIYKSLDETCDDHTQNNCLATKRVVIQFCLCSLQCINITK